MWLVTVSLGVTGVVLTLMTPAGSIPDPGAAPSFKDVLFPIEAIAFSTVGFLIVSRRSNLVGWLMCVAGITYLVADEFASRYITFDVYVHRLPASGLVGWFDAWVWIPDFGILLIALPLLFPDGRPVSIRWRWLGVAAAGIVGAMTLVLMVGSIALAMHIERHVPLSGNQFGPLIGAMLGSGFPLMVVCGVAAAISLVLRYRRAGTDVRHQLKWITASMALVAIGLILSLVVSGPLQGYVKSSIAGDLAQIALLTLPISVGVAVLRFHLYEIDVIISRALLYGALAAFISGLYVAIVVGIGTAVGTGGRPNLGLSILATAAVAVAFQPVRAWLERAANRLVYGRRATPYEVITGFSHRMAGTMSIEAALPRIAEAAARGVGAGSGRVRLFLPDGSERRSVWPDGLEEIVYDRTLPVMDRGEPIGEIAVAQRPGEPMTPVEESLLADLAAQSELALHNVRLTLELQSRLSEILSQAAELRSSRQRLVTARDAERRRLETALHDGVERELGEIRAQLRLTAGHVAEDPVGAAGALDQLAARATAALDELRDVARGIFPPLLADRGLVPALEAHFRKSGIEAAVEADDATAGGRFAEQVEVTAYFCCVEALRGEAVGTGRSPASVRLQRVDGLLEFAVPVADGGEPVAPLLDRWQAMRDRVEALGGTLVVEPNQGSTRLLIGRVPVSSPPSAAVLETVG